MIIILKMIAYKYNFWSVNSLVVNNSNYIIAFITNMFSGYISEKVLPAAVRLFVYYLNDLLICFQFL